MPNCTRFTWRNGAFESVVVLILQRESTYNSLNNNELCHQKEKGSTKIKFARVTKQPQRNANASWRVGLRVKVKQYCGNKC